MKFMQRLNVKDATNHVSHVKHLLMTAEAVKIHLESNTFIMMMNVW